MKPRKRSHAFFGESVWWKEYTESLSRAYHHHQEKQLTRLFSEYTSLATC